MLGSRIIQVLKAKLETDTADSQDVVIEIEATYSVT